MTNVLVLGATGMLGRAVTNAFSDFDGNVTVTSRAEPDPALSPKTRQLQFDAEKQDLSFLEGERFDYIINCIGLIKSEINEQAAKSIQSAVELNFDLPMMLSEHARSSGAKVLQIATDCVYSGRKGRYVESDSHDPLDIYGKTKSLGEIPSENMMHIRVSIIGKENRGHKSLYDWVRLQPIGAEIRGFTDHYWNGVPALALGRVFRGIIEKSLFISGVHHLLPAGVVTKAELVEMIARHEGRSDIKIEFGPSGHRVDRSLDSEGPDFSKQLWQAAGFDRVPTIQELVAII